MYRRDTSISMHNLINIKRVAICMFEDIADGYTWRSLVIMRTNIHHCANHHYALAYILSHRWPPSVSLSWCFSTMSSQVRLHLYSVFLVLDRNHPFLRLCTGGILQVVLATTSGAFRLTEYQFFISRVCRANVLKENGWVPMAGPSGFYACKHVSILTL